MAITWPPLQSSYCKLEALNLTMPLLSGADVRSYHTREDAIYATAMFLMQKLSVDARLICHCASAKHRIRSGKNKILYIFLYPLDWNHAKDEAKKGLEQEVSYRLILAVDLRFELSYFFG